MASNGQEAFEFVQQKLNNEPSEYYDLVLLDLQMPICNGFEACEKIFNLFYSDQLGQEEVQINENTSIQFSQRQLPLLVACSSTPTSEQLLKNLHSIGFHLFIEQPLENEKIDELIGHLYQRRQKIELYNDSMVIMEN